MAESHEIELDLSDLMESETPTDATDTDDTTTLDEEDQSSEGTPAPDPRDVEIANLREHVNNLLTKLGTQPETAHTEPATVPDVYPEIEKLFDDRSAAAAVKMAQLIEQRIDAKLKQYTPKAEWDAAQPVIQRTALTLGEQEVRNKLLSLGATEDQLARAKEKAGELMRNGEKFSSHAGAYRAGLAEVHLEDAQRTAAQTKAARAAKTARSQTNDNTPPDTPATKATIKASEEEILNNPFGMLDRIAQAGVK